MTKKFGLVPSEKIFGIGMGKTGTKTLAKAIGILGYKEVYHGDGKHKHTGLDWVSGVQFWGDIPAAARYKFLDFCFPHAKFILTIRDTESWLRSAKHYAFRKGDKGGAKKTDGYKDGMLTTKLDRMYPRFLLFGRVTFNEHDHTIGYEKHNREVFEHFFYRMDKLLILRICDGEGWEKLCPFLGCEIPDVPFPHKGKQFDKEEGYGREGEQAEGT